MQDRHNHCLVMHSEGVRIAGNMLGHVEKLRYSDHDVIDTDKFLEFSKKVYLETVGIGPFGEPINQPVQWVARLAKNRDSRPVGHPTLWEGPIHKQLRQEADGSHPWRIPVAGTDHLNRCRAHCIHHRDSIMGGGHPHSSLRTR
jgi:hypothetical protein